MKYQSEKELAEDLINYLKSDGWKIFPEIMNIDIVAIKENEIIGVIKYCNKFKKICKNIYFC